MDDQQAPAPDVTEAEVRAYSSTIPADVLDHPERYDLDPNGLNWAMRLLARAERDRGELTEQRQVAVAQIDEWFRDRVGGPDRIASAATAMITGWIRYARTVGTKSLSTPYGTISSRRGATVLRITDEPRFITDRLGKPGQDAVAALRRTLGPLFTVTVKVNRAEFDRRSKVVRSDVDGGPVETVLDGTTGEVWAGVTVEHREASVTIRPADAAPWIPNPATGLMPAGERVARPTAPPLPDDEPEVRT